MLSKNNTISIFHPTKMASISTPNLVIHFQFSKHNIHLRVKARSLACAAQKQLEEDLEREAGDAGTLSMNVKTREEYMAIKARAGAATGTMKQELTALQAVLQVCHSLLCMM